MNMSKANELLSLTANVGVIASIIFLGVEMQQNTDMMKSQTRNSIVENQLTFYEAVIDNPDFAAVVNDLRLDAELYQPGSMERIQYHLQCRNLECGKMNGISTKWDYLMKKSSILELTLGRQTLTSQSIKIFGNLSETIFRKIFEYT